MSGARQARAFGEINQYHHATSCIIIIILVIVIVTISIISCNRAWVDCLGLFLGATSFVPSTSTPTASSHPLSLVFSVRLLLHVLASPPWAFVWIRFASSVVRGSGAADLGPDCITALLIIVFESGAKPANRTLELAFAFGNALGAQGHSRPTRLIKVVGLAGPSVHYSVERIQAATERERRMHTHEAGDREEDAHTRSSKRERG
jgi:hypothetical protein